MGDFNIDLLQYDTQESSRNFYDTLSSFSYRPLILQPSRVTSRSATLIDNIMINNLETKSIGGNLTISISDHFPQFCLIDTFTKSHKEKSFKYGRNFRNFNQNEFSEELKTIDWNMADKSTDDGVGYLLNRIENLLNEMAPVKKLTKKEVRLQKRPWITNGILISMKGRDKKYKEFVKEKDPIVKNKLHIQYKKMRNLIISLIRSSKKDYYAYYFEQHKSNVKKTWEGIRNIVNVSKKSNVSPSQLLYKNELHTSNNGMANAMNDFFVNIGNTVEDKIPRVERDFSSYLNDPNVKSIFLNPVTTDETIYLISQIKLSKSCGPNSIPNNILKTNMHVLADPITILLNKSISEGTFPNLLKLANVCPIY